MVDPLSTLFCAVQKESYQNVIGKPEYDRRTFAVLQGDNAEPSKKKPQSLRTMVWLTIMVALLIATCLLTQLG